MGGFFFFNVNYLKQLTIVYKIVYNIAGHIKGENLNGKNYLCPRS